MKDDMMCSRTDCTACDVFQRPNETDVEWKDRLRKMMTADANDVCENGHPRDENWAQYSSGAGRCRACKREYDRTRKRRAGERVA